MYSMFAIDGIVTEVTSHFKKLTVMVSGAAITSFG